MRRALLIAIAAACKSKEPPPAPAPPPADAAVADWKPACKAALARASSVTPARRVMHVIDGCKPCGDWAPLLHWNTPSELGGPTREAIAAAMEGCRAYCTDAARGRFLGALDESRGQPGRGPWKALGEVCKDAVSAVPDARYESAPYFALDRIARAVAADPALAPLGAVTLPLPAVSLSGVGYELPVSPVTKPDAGPLQLTVTLGELRVGTLPSATLGTGAVVADPRAAGYPGELATAKDLAAALDKLGARDARIAVIAPAKLPAQRLVEAIAAAGPRPLALAVAAAGAPPGWSLAGTIPVALVATPDKSGKRFELTDATLDAALHAVKDAPAFTAPATIAIGPATTVASVAKLLGTLAFRDVSTVALVVAAK